MRTLGIAFTLFLGPLFAQGAPRALVFGLKPHCDTPDHAGRLAKKYGQLQSRDSMTGTYTLTLREEAKPESALRAIKARPDVVFVRLANPAVSTAAMPMHSLSGMNASLKELRSRKQDHVLMRRSKGLPAPAKTETVKTGYYESHQYWLEQRAYPNDRIDYGAYRRAWDHIEQMESPATMSDFGGSTWEFLGPTNLDIPYRTYYGVRPINGRVNAFAVDPSNPDVFYLGSANGGVWKSMDHGTNWMPLTDTWQYLTVSSLAIDPANPQTIYVGTGDFPGGKNFTQGLMKSTNGGASWTQYNHPDFANAEISSIIVDPENPNLITMTCGRGSAGSGFIMRSLNGGVTWSRALNVANHWFRVEMGPIDGLGARMYYAVGSGIDNLWKSSDRGASWTRMGTPFTASVTTISVAASPNTPGTLYVMSYLKVHKSTNFGATWTDVSAGFPNGSNNYFWSQFSYNWFFEASKTPTGQDVLYVGAIDVAQSPDGGATWRSIGGPTFANVALTHNDQHYVHIDPTNPNRVHIGGDGGAYEYLYNPSAGTGAWSYFSRNLGISQFYEIAVHPTNPNYVMGGTQDNATPHSLGDLTTWENVGGGDGGFCAINPSNTNVQYATSQSLNIYRTGNAWSSSGNINPSTGSEPRAFIAPIVLDPNNPNLLYAGTNFLYRRNDATSTWQNRLGNQQLSATGTIRDIAIAPGDSSRIYTGSSAGELWMSTDNGVTWRNISSGLPNRVITSVVVNPADKNDIFVTVSSTGTAHLFRCTNTLLATPIWQDVDGSGVTGLPNTPATSIALDPFEFDTVWYVGTDLGVFVTENAGNTWQNATQPLGLPNTSIGDVKIAPATGYLTAGTFGRGMWRLKLPSVFSIASFITIAGTPFGGVVADLSSSNNSYVTTLFDSETSNGVIEFSGVAPSATATRLDLALETKSTRADLVQIVECFNTVSNTWDPVDTSFAPTQDVRRVIKILVNPSRFIHPTTKVVKSRIRWSPTEDLTTIDGWSTAIDRLQWRLHN